MSNERPKLTLPIPRSKPAVPAAAPVDVPVAVPVVVTPEPVERKIGWDELGLSPDAMATIAKQGFATPTSIQAQCLGPAIQGRDILASSQTGTGKTLGFVLPMVEKFIGREGTFGLVLAPTREIAQQIEATIRDLGAHRGIRSAVLIGGVDYAFDERALATYPQILVATPGRLCDHLDRGNIWLDFIEVLVLDEADRMLDMGFADQLKRVLQDTPEVRQTMLFSATIPAPIERLADKHLKDPVRITVGRPLSAAATVDQRVVEVPEKDKNVMLRRLLNRVPGTTIVFTRSKDRATQVYRSLHSNGFYDATYIHSDRLQSHREQALADFKSGKYRILIATDVAGRGIHVDGVAHVINFDLPMEAEDYIHRIGRTGRAEAMGIATTFVTPHPEDRRTLQAVEKLLKRKLPFVRI